MTLPERIASSLAAQRESLVADWNDWVERVKPGGELQQHNTQVNTIRRRLEGALDAALESNPIEPPPATVDMLENGRRAIEVIHLTWTFFRDKFAQRDSKRYRRHLLVADEIAWECYAPVLDAYVEAANAPREPPLVFYAPERSPAAQLRTSAYYPPGLSSLDVEAFLTALKHLPVPLIGVPQPQSVLVPPLVFVGHEVGHVIAEDFGLLEELEQRVEALDLGNRKANWRRWLDEVFADALGVLATGSAYAEQLATILAGSLADVRNEPIGRDGKYPTRALRMALCNGVLRRLVSDEFVRDVTYNKAWRQTYGDTLTGALSPYKEDVPKIVTAILAEFSQLGGKRLQDVLPWDARSEENLDALAKEHLMRAESATTFSVRLWVAAAARASVENPRSYHSRTSTGEDCDAWMVKQIEKLRGRGPRAANARALGPRMRDGSPRLQHVAADKTAGHELAILMGIAPERKERS